MEHFITNKSIINYTTTTIFQNTTTPTVEQLPLEDEEISTLKRIAIILLAIAFFILSVGGNSLVILAYITDKNVRIPSNAYLVALAFVDFLIGIFVIPFGFIYNYNLRWDYGTNLCQTWLSLCYGLSAISSGHLVLIALDRYRILFQGLSYLHRRTMCDILESVLFLWILGFWIIFPIIVDWDHVAFDPLTKKHCITKKSATWVLLINMGIFLLPGFFILRLYSEIYLELRRRLREKANKSVNPSPQPSTSNNYSNAAASCSYANYNGQGRLAVPVFKVDINSDLSDNDIENVVKKRKNKICLRKERKAVCTLGVLIGAFFICWIPYFVVTSIQAFAPEIKFPKTVNAACALLGWVNTCVNPIVYAVRNKEFQIAFKRIFHCKKH